MEFSCDENTILQHSVDYVKDLSIVFVELRPNIKVKYSNLIKLNFYDTQSRFLSQSFSSNIDRFVFL